MNEFCHMAQHPDAERYIPAMLPWVSEAADDYFDWVFGGEAAAKERLSAWMRRPSSQYSIRAMVILFKDAQPAGGYISLGGEEFQRRRKADMLALVTETKRDKRPMLLQRLSALSHPAFVVGPDQSYDRVVGVCKEFRGHGLGRKLVEHRIEEGKATGFRRFLSHVRPGNTPMLRIYESVGFKRVGEIALGTGKPLLEMSLEL